MNMQYITEASLAVQIHLVAAVLALVFGCVMWFRPKGTSSHKMIGRGFVILMLGPVFWDINVRGILFLSHLT